MGECILAFLLKSGLFPHFQIFRNILIIMITKCVFVTFAFQTSLYIELYKYIYKIWLMRLIENYFLK